jgi:hypothetical protein
MSDNPLREGQILTGSLFSEPIRLESVRAVSVYARDGQGMTKTRIRLRRY